MQVNSAFRYIIGKVTIVFFLSKILIYCTDSINPYSVQLYRR